MRGGLGLDSRYDVVPSRVVWLHVQKGRPKLHIAEGCMYRTIIPMCNLERPFCTCASVRWTIEVKNRLFEEAASKAPLDCVDQWGGDGFL